MKKQINVSGNIGDVVTAYLSEKPDKREICPVIMILLDYLTDDNSENELTINQFMANAMRKRVRLQALIEEWRRN